MKNLLKYSLLALAITLTASISAHADGWSDWGWGQPKHHHHDKPANLAPEVDPSLALSGLTLLGGTLTVLRSRRRK